MRLRDHPLMNYRGIGNWPPRWHARGDGVAPSVAGEAGVLTEVTMSYRSAQNVSPPQLFLFMEHHGHRYIAAVLFSDETFCRQVGMLLQNHCGRALEEIGGLDVSDLL
ncbi:MAG TPA: hypothetical protein VGH16_23520 [Candidatus Binatia bacterium]|jgi:hypothetical protein